MHAFCILTHACFGPATAACRYKLLVDALYRTFGGVPHQAPIAYSSEVHYLDERLRELHMLLLNAGLGQHASNVQLTSAGSGQASLVSWEEWSV